MRTYSILHTSARPEKWREVYEAWIKAADHPERVEYVLVVDERWGFEAGKIVIPLRADSDEGQNFQRFNTKRKCYVDGVNLAAESATGDVLIVNADDQYPAPHWDSLLDEIIDTRAADSRCNGQFVVWANTGTPREKDRRIMPMPILSRARYQSLGYVFYPAYESMYADNDFCESALQDYSNGKCTVLTLSEEYLFPHRHAFFTQGVETDEAYKAQNRPEAYTIGQEIFLARKVNRFAEIKGNPASRRRRIAICTAGETFSAAWMHAWTQLITGIGKYHDAMAISFTSSNVYQTRMVMAEEALRIAPEVDYILMIDDDNLVSLANVLQLITDLEFAPNAAMVAGWTLTGSPMVHTERTLSFGSLGDDNSSTPTPESYFLSRDCTDFHRVDYTGFPVVLMRRSFLDAMTPNAFAPLPCTSPNNRFHFCGEDVSFCSRAIDKGYEIYVDRRVAVPHLKLRDILTLPGGSVKFTQPSPPPEPKLPRVAEREYDSSTQRTAV